MHDEIDFFYSKRDNTAEKVSKARFGLKMDWWNKFKNKFPNSNQLKFIPSVLTNTEKGFISFFLLLIAGSIIYAGVVFYNRGTVQTPDFGGRYVEGLLGEPKQINPILLQVNDTDRDIASLVYSGLMKNNGQGELTTDLAEKYDILDKGTTYIFHLRDDILWHDGQKFTADDVVFTIQTIQNTEFGSPQRVNWQGVTVEKIDNKTVKFSLRIPYAQLLANTTIGILPRHVWSSVKASEIISTDLNLKPIGTGPYKFVEVKSNKSGKLESVELIANKNYKPHQPYIENLEFRFYQSEDLMLNALLRHEVQGISSLSAANYDRAEKSGIEIKKMDLSRLFLVFINMDNEIFKDKNVRLALAHATNKEEILSKVLNGRGSIVDSPILPAFFHLNTDFIRYDYNPDLAKSILENSGWKENDGSVRSKNDKILSINLTTSKLPELNKTVSLLKEEWSKVGFDVNITAVDLPQLQEDYIKTRNYDTLFFGEVLTTLPDPFSFWHSSQKEDPGLNISKYNNKKTDQLLEQARQTTDPIARAKIYDDFQKIIIDDVPAIFLYSPSYLYPLPDKIKGIDNDLISLPSDRFANIENWYINTKRSKN